ncbi:MAG: hypothetical protein JW807_14890 [Spirochaetes bacterium]|nr:hypothetical protein [Spirochaetota bacterium]
MKSHFHISVVLFVTIALMAGTAAWADTVILFQGSVLVGKIIEEDDRAIIMKNYYGKFKVKKIKIDNIYKTNSYEEDIALHKKMRLPLDEEQIIRNYNAGAEIEEVTTAEEGEDKSRQATEDTQEDKKKGLKVSTVDKEQPGGDKWTSGRLTFSGFFQFTLMSRDSTHPYGMGGYFAFDQGLDFMSGGRHPMIPGLRFEGGYINFRNSKFKIYGATAAAGLMWAWPSMKNSWGCFTLGLLPGASYVITRIRSSIPAQGDLKGRSINFTPQAIFGYQKSWGVFSLFVQARGMYIMGYSGWDHLSVGAEAGIGFNAW